MEGRMSQTTDTARDRLPATVVFNHPTFNLGGVNVQNTAFGQSTAGPNTARRIELRANLEF